VLTGNYKNAKFRIFNDSLQYLYIAGIQYSRYAATILTKSYSCFCWAYYCLFFISSLLTRESDTFVCFICVFFYI